MKHSLFEDSDFSLPSFQDSPLYTPEEQEEMHKKKVTLEMEVQTLEQQLKNRREQIIQSKENIVPFGEVSLMRTQILKNFSDKNSDKLENIVEDINKVVSEICSLSTQMYLADQEVKEEELNRLNLMEEYDLIESVFDLSDLQPMAPNISSAEKIIPKVDRMELERFEGIIKKINSDIVDIVTSSDPSFQQMDAANAQLKMRNAQIDLKLVGTNLLKSEGKRLEMLYSTSSSRIKKLEAETNSLKSRLTAIENDIESTEVAGKAQETSNKNLFNESIQALDREIELIKEKINQTADWFDSANKELERLRLQEASTASLEYLEQGLDMNTEDDDNEIFHFSGSNDKWKEIEESLKEKKYKLLTEIQKLRNDYNESKNLAKERSIRAQKYIKEVYTKFHKNQCLIDELKVKYPLPKQKTKRKSYASSANTSRTEYNSFTDDFNIVLQKLDNSLQEIQQTIDGPMDI